jgi:hypothetical protein
MPIPTPPAIKPLPSSAKGASTRGEINYYHSEGNTIIQFQTDVDAEIEGGIQGLQTPDASWFVL